MKTKAEKIAKLAPRLRESTKMQGQGHEKINAFLQPFSPQILAGF